MRFSVSDMCQTALLAAFIAISGSFKIPSLIPGSEISAFGAGCSCGLRYFRHKKIPYGRYRGFCHLPYSRHAKCF